MKNTATTTHTRSTRKSSGSTKSTNSNRKSKSSPSKKSSRTARKNKKRPSTAAKRSSLKAKRPSTQHTPKVSVVMPVYNAGAYLHQSIQSMLDQSMQEFELIMVNDASTDNSLEIMQDYAHDDHRITIINNSTNLGVSRSVKKAMRKAQANYIARMDADDISHPKRLEKQLNYLERHDDVVALGTQCTVINENGTRVGSKTFPLKHEDIYKYIFRFIPVQQPSLMIARHRLPNSFAFYNDSFTTAEEVELIFKLFQHGKVENLPQKLLKYRIHRTNTSFVSIKKTFYNTLLSRIQAVYTYNYKPTLTGLAFTIAQTFAVLLLPETVIMYMYSSMRRVKSYSFSPRKLFKTMSLRFPKAIADISSH